MRHRALGQDGPMVHPIGVGAMSFTDFYGPTTEADGHAILDAALAAGVNHIDTANVYGMGGSESTIGSYLKARPDARGRFSVATKAAISRRPDGTRAFDNTTAHLEAELDRSLVRMGLESVDLFYVHRRDPDIPIEEVTETLAGLVNKGKTLGIGFSEIAPTSLRRAHAVHPVAAVQSEYSLQTRLPELGLIQTCAELGVALVAFSPVGRSLLTDAPLSREAIGEIGFLNSNPRFMEPNHSANIAATSGFRALAAEMGASAAGLAVAWVLAKGDHVIAIPGTRSVPHFNEFLDATRLVLGPEEIAAIESVLPAGWCHGDRYSDAQWVGPERYC